MTRPELLSFAGAEDASLSLVVPLYNERDNVGELLRQIAQSLTGMGLAWEVILVDDGSIDGTGRAAERLAQQYGPHVRVRRLRRNFGQTAAVQAGIDVARGSLIATLDGDLQNDPSDVPKLVRRLIDDDLDMVSGWRADRKDTYVSRRLPSLLANWIIRRATGVQLHDYGCSLKVYRAELLRDVRLYGEMHRFIPVWIATRTSPDRIGEQVVQHHPRRAGVSKYGIGRTSRVILDLLAIIFFLRFAARPGHFFGLLGLGFGLSGGAILAYLAVLKLAGEDIGDRPLLLAGTMLAIVAVQFVLTGIQSEMISRIYFSTGGSSYVVHETPAEPPLARPPRDETWAS